MRFQILIVSVLVLAASATSASAQTTTIQPINPTAAVVPATDTTASLVGNAIRGLGRAVAGTLEDNAMIRALNNLLGRTVTTPTQAGFSPLPMPSAFQSTKYPNSFQPAAPVMSTFGQNPTSIFPRK